MVASTTQILLTAVGVLLVTIVPFGWGLYRTIRHVNEHQTTEEERMM